MIEIRRNDEIYATEGGWFRARWHFSFDRYRDPHNDGFGALRVFNDDRLEPGAIWPMHPHKDVEGLTIVVEGSFGHEDNVGGAPGPLPAGSVQRMTLGSGAYHSERNASPTEPMRFIQLWILPDTPNLPPSVEQKVLTRDDRTDRLRKVFGRDGADVSLHQDAAVYIGFLTPGTEVTHALGAGRGAYLYVIDGAIALIDRAATPGETMLGTGDAAKITSETTVALRADAASDLVLVDVPMVFEPVGIWRR